MLACLFLAALVVVLAVCSAFLPVLVAFGVAALAAGAAVALAWWAGPGLLAHLLGAHQVEPSDEPRVHNLLDSLCLSVGVQKPRVLLIDVETPNVCSIGASSRSTSIVVTRGLVDMLSIVELEGALARELVQLKRGGVAGRTLVALAVGLLAGIVGAAGLRALGSCYGGEEREALADIEAVSVTRYPPALQDAIMKMSVAACDDGERSTSSKVGGQPELNGQPEENGQAAPASRRVPFGWRATNFLWMIRPICPSPPMPPPTAGTRFPERSGREGALARNARIRIEMLAEI